MDSNKAPHGTYTPIPNVFFDTCDLPETAQILYLRLYRQIHYRGCQFTGSIRTLAKLVRLSKSTTDRMVKKLEQARLITVEREPGQTNMQVMTITILKDNLWELNKQHEIEPVPIWDTTLPGCPKLGQPVPTEGQAVPDRDELSQAQAQKGAVINTNKPKQKEKEITPPQSFEMRNQKKRRKDKLPSLIDTDVTKAVNQFGEYDNMEETKDAIFQIFKICSETIEEFDFRMKLASAIEEARRQPSNKSEYLVKCLTGKCKLSSKSISVPA